MFRNVQLCLSLSLYNIYSRKFSCNFYSCHWQISQVSFVISLDNRTECLKNAILCQIIVRSNVQHTQTCIIAWGFSAMVNRLYFLSPMIILAFILLFCFHPFHLSDIGFRKEYSRICTVFHNGSQKKMRSFYLDVLMPVSWIWFENVLTVVTILWSC